MKEQRCAVMSSAIFFYNPHMKVNLVIPGYLT